MNKYKLYARVSDKSQNLSSQIRDLRKAHPDGVLYQEKLSGVSRRRPEREKMLSELVAGEVVVCIRMSRLSRSMQDLFDVVAKIETKGCHVRFIHEDIRTDTSHGRLVFNIMASINSYHRELINDSCSAGRKVALEKGVKFGKPRKIKPAQEKLVRKLKEEGKTHAEITEATGIKKGTLYLILNPDKRKQYNKSHKIYLAAQRQDSLENCAQRDDV
jgi:DNA invertase Pin-like site-specific DNA recombinase